MSQDVNVCWVNVVTQANKMAAESPDNLTFTETEGVMRCYVKTVEEKIDDENGSGGDGVFLVMARRGSQKIFDTIFSSGWGGYCS